MIYIDMDMPKSCRDCRFVNIYDDFRCTAFPKDFDECCVDIEVFDDVRADICPLREVKE